ncbi:C40 family peptidase [Streptomyces sp. NPDC020412]|uniref:C40 family peptidase n=1 Tax=Streptomyces sp. NPDC020412 TaxID=3365073 RepID=UPI0037952F92
MAVLIPLQRSRRARRLGLLVGATVAAGAALVPVVVIKTTAPVAGAAMAGVTCAVSGLQLAASTGASYKLTADQIRNAEAIVATGVSMDIPVRGRVVAIATALQESMLRNIRYGDRDSLGLFQQRPSMGWGTPEQIMNPVYSSWKFYKGLQRIPDWQGMSVTDAAQAVQRSGFPQAYAKHESMAVNIVAGMSGSSGGAQQINASSGCTPVGTPASTTAAGYVQIALQQVGKPYVWGGTGPNGFDCSGLIVYAWRKMGYQLKVRTSQQMHAVSLPVAQGTEKSGDLIFTRFEAGGPTHVMVVVRPGLAVEAPRTGLDVRVREYDPRSESMKFGRLPSSQMTQISTQV